MTLHARPGKPTRAAARGRLCFTSCQLRGRIVTILELCRPETGRAREDQIRRDRSETARSGMRAAVIAPDIPPRRSTPVFGWYTGRTHTWIRPAADATRALPALWMVLCTDGASEPVASNAPTAGTRYVRPRIRRLRVTLWVNQWHTIPALPAYEPVPEPVTVPCVVGTDQTPVNFPLYSSTVSPEFGTLMVSPLGMNGAAALQNVRMASTSAWPPASSRKN